MNNKTCIPNRSLWALLVLLAMSFASHAQLTVGADLRSVFNNFTPEPAVLIKYRFGADRFAARLIVSGTQSHMEGIQNFYEDDRYYNLDQWPSSVSKTGNVSNNTGYSISPGFEYRHTLAPSTRIYGAVECAIIRNKMSNTYGYHSSYLDPNLNQYVIVQVFEGNNDFTYKAYSPAVRLGVEQDLGLGFSLFGEVGINGSIYQQYGENTFERYNWNGSTFEKAPEPDAFKDQDIPWNSTISWTPNFRLFLAYTFGGSSEEKP